jgi:drug/metabolite transporter (DMT)-like permease
MTGTATFFLVLLLGAILLPFSETPSKYFSFTSEIWPFYIGSSILGIICTWLPFLLWNNGCKKIPISLSGQLMVFEILFALCLIYLIEHKLPTLSEIIGIIFMFSGVLLSLKNMKSATE